MSELPNGWVEAGLLDIVELHDTKRIPLNKTERSARQGSYPYYGANGLVDHIDGYLFEGEHVLLAEDGGNFDIPGKPVAYRVDGKFWVNNHAHILKPRDSISTGFVLNWCNYNNWMPYVGGTTRLKLTQQGMKKVPVRIPPLAEQKRIVAKLDALSARSARARKDLERIDALVARYKQAVLSKAFDPSHGRPSIFFRDYIRTANNGLSKRTGEEGPEVNVLRLADLVDGEFSPAAPRKIRLTDKEIKKYLLHAGDLVVIRVNGSSSLVGRAFDYKENDVWAFCDHFIRIQLDEHCDPEFTSMYLNSPHVRSIIEQNFVSTSGQKTISQKTLEELPAPDLPLPEQREIVRRIESAFEKIDRLAGEAKRALAL